ncbi:AhpC/TSA family protein [Polaribacter sp. BAL334]|uniref:TlpA disulfide reductase family protein n=1 Tax=Polaribacter sp. BAL334 TaxID=1708178 RepID=UPI0018D245B3|nr:TlpA disulfide reductase family protein [Polaribacter sp. BAL334]MBG7610906.1 AhpC/TSA family protein [Polaribacter sp. BAL334]
MNLKKIFLLFNLLTVITLFNCTKTDKINESDYYEINAIIKGVKENSKVVLLNYDEKKVIDSTIIKQGKFYFKGKIEFPFEAAISIDDEWLMIPFWVEQGEISISTDKQTLKKSNLGYHEFIKGGEINDMNLKFNKYIEPSQVKKGLKYKEMKEGVISEKEFQNQIDTIFKNVNAFFKNDSNANNYFSLSQMINYREGIPKKDLKIYYNKLSQKLKDSPKGKALYDYFTYDGVKVGEIAPEIIAKNVNRKEISLKDYRGNYVLLDFWASWCMPCIEEIKTTLPILYKKYQSDNFKIISFSTDNDTESWIKKSNELKMAWDNISNNIKANINSVAIKYGVKVLPTRFLIDPNGIVIKRFTNEEDLLIEVEKVMNK